MQEYYDSFQKSNFHIFPITLYLIFFEFVWRLIWIPFSNFVIKFLFTLIENVNQTVSEETDEYRVFLNTKVWNVYSTICKHTKRIENIKLKFPKDLLTLQNFKLQMTYSGPNLTIFVQNIRSTVICIVYKELRNPYMIRSDRENIRFSFRVQVITVLS